jgi:hypothetical protein
MCDMIATARRLIADPIATELRAVRERDRRRARPG